MNELQLIDGHLIVRYNEGNMGLYVENCYIENGNLYVKYVKEDGTMAVKDLGKVVGEQGPQGPAGERGPQGAQGTAGENGISPTFRIDENGHLLADYDNPYTGE